MNNSFNRIRILNDNEFKVVGLDNLKFEVGYYRTADHRFHGVDMSLNNNDYDNHLAELPTNTFLHKFIIHPDDGEWLKNKIANMNRLEDTRICIDNVEFSILHNAREYAIAGWYGWNEEDCKAELYFKTNFYPLLDVVLAWAVQCVVETDSRSGAKAVVIDALEKLATKNNCCLDTRNEKERICKEFLDEEQPF